VRLSRRLAAEALVKQIAEETATAASAPVRGRVALLAQQA